MTFEGYINFIIKHASDFIITYFRTATTPEQLKIAPDRFLINYKDPDTGRVSNVLNIKIVDNYIIDVITGLKIADKTKIYYNALLDFGMNEKGSNY